ncbi:hypothetical protein [Pannonibacter carbonis]|uniref:hypothetical protein n=1 Tax=Pannonibacter carbonis TaxID=2067569 RepID=UPI000D0F33CE|nr:hypothetical protein [Pannonibacter carbonis]
MKTDLPLLQRHIERVLPENPLFRLLAINGAVGVLVSLLVLVGLLVSNAAGLRDLIVNADDPVVPIVLLGFGLIITLGSAVMGTAIMSLPSDEDTGSGRRDRIEGELIPIRVHATVRRPLPRD